MDAATIAIIGGSGLYEIKGVSDLQERNLDTPFGRPSDSIISGHLHGTKVFFLARHARTHRYSPSEVNYRANIYALKSLGAQWCISISAVGSLAEEVKPGDMLVPDQIIDRTRQRESTFFEGGLVAHVSLADPYCPVLRGALYESAAQAAVSSNFKAHNGGVYVCMEGPAFSTRAESNMYRSLGGRVIGMTNLPEAKLAREAEMAYATLALITDYDCWKQGEEDVDVTTVINRLKAQSEQAKLIVAGTVEKLRHLTPSTLATDALKNAFLTKFEHVPRETLERLKPIVGRYLA